MSATNVVGIPVEPPVISVELTPSEVRSLAKTVAITIEKLQRKVEGLAPGTSYYTRTADDLRQLLSVQQELGAAIEENL